MKIEIVETGKRHYNRLAIWDELHKAVLDLPDGKCCKIAISEFGGVKPEAILSSIRQAMRIRGLRVSVSIPSPTDFVYVAAKNGENGAK